MINGEDGFICCLGQGMCVDWGPSEELLIGGMVIIIIVAVSVIVT